MFQSHRTCGFDNGSSVAANRGQPCGNFACIRNRGRKADEGDFHRQMDDHFFPDRATVFVLKEVHLVENDVGKVIKCCRGGVDHVAQHLGGHDEDRRIGIDARVARQKANIFGSEADLEVSKLLV